MDHYKAFRQLRKRIYSFVTGNKEEYLSVLELVNSILKLMDSNLEPVILNEGNYEIKNQYLSIEKAKKILKWKPHFTLEEGLKKTINWYKEYS